MKKVLSLIFVLSSFVAFSQSTTFQSTATTKLVNRGLIVADSGLILTAKDTTAWFGLKSDFVRKASNGKLYFFDGVKYSELGSGQNLQQTTDLGNTTTQPIYSTSSPNVLNPLNAGALLSGSGISAGGDQNTLKDLNYYVAGNGIHRFNHRNVRTAFGNEFPTIAYFFGAISGKSAYADSQYVTLGQILDTINRKNTLQNVTTGGGKNVTSNALQVTGFNNLNNSIKGGAFWSQGNDTTEHYTFIRNRGNNGNTSLGLAEQAFSIQADSLYFLANNILPTRFNFFGTSQLQYERVAGASGTLPNDFVTKSQLDSVASNAVNIGNSDLIILDNRNVDVNGKELSFNSADRISLNTTNGNGILLSDCVGECTSGISINSFSQVQITSPATTYIGSGGDINISSGGGVNVESASFRVSSNVSSLGVSLDLESLSEDRTVKFQDKDGTVALMDTLVVSSSNISFGRAGYYSKTGTTGTWELPSAASSVGTRYVVVNKGSGTLTVNTTAEANEIWEAGMTMNTLNIAATENIIIFSDGITWNILN